MKKKPWILASICLIAAIPCVSQTQADSTRSLNQHELLEQHLADFVYSQATAYHSEDYGSRNINIETSKIDPRIAIPQCDEEFQLDMDPDALEQTHFSVRISCDSQDWYIYSTARLSFTQDVVVTNGNLGANTFLTADHLRIEQHDSSKIRNTGFQRIEDVIGAKTKYRARDGQPVVRRMLCYVCQGDRVTIAARVGGMQVKTTGIAQEDGTLGETIRVMNARSKKAVYGQVASTEEVIVRL
jgi:flagella basal body P-ring formation protein FlgA